LSSKPPSKDIEWFNDVGCVVIKKRAEDETLIPEECKYVPDELFRTID